MPAIDSTAIRHVRYRDEPRELDVTFKDSGKTYTYVGVPKSRYAALLEADSVGAYFNERIRDRFPYKPHQ